MRGDTPDPQTYVTASKAASMLGLEERLIEWALDRHILAGQRDEQGRWTVSHGEIEAGQRPLEEQFDYLWTRDDRKNGATKRGAGLPDEPKTDQAIDAPTAAAGVLIAPERRRGATRAKRARHARCAPSR